MPDPAQVIDYNRYLYARGNPVKYNDPSGHCIFGLDTIVCIVAAAALGGGMIGGGWYAINEAQQPDGLDLHVNASWNDGPVVDIGDDWGDLGVATLSGAASGAFVASGQSYAIAVGANMAANQIVDHGANSLTGQNFSASQHALASATGLAAGIIAPGLEELVIGAPAIINAPGYVQAVSRPLAIGATQGVINAAGEYVLEATQGQAQWNNGTIGWGIVAGTFGQIGDLHPTSAAWQTFSATSGEMLATGIRLNADIVSSTVYQNTMTSNISPIDN